jgi:hypothetical protein
MESRTLLQQYVGISHNVLEETLGETTPEQATAQPSGNANSIAANYAHVVTAEDFLINNVGFGKPPLFATTMAGKTGLSEPPTQGDWSEWAKRVQIDFPALRAYGQAVHANTDALITGASEEDLGRDIDLTSFGFGHMPLGVFIALFAGGHINMHTGEISCLKGLQGMKGYPF